jgi:hypothetical protein
MKKLAIDKDLLVQILEEVNCMHDHVLLNAQLQSAVGTA